MNDMDFSSVGMMLNQDNIYNPSNEDPRTKTGWWNAFSGGKTDKTASVAQSDYLNEWNANQAEIARNFDSYQADISRQFNSAEAQKQRDYETFMSNTAYTRAMQDMKKAGLNPALMYARGNMTASTPGGAQATSTPARSGGHATGQKPNYTPSATGQLAGLIGAIAFSSAKAVSSVSKLGTIKKATKLDPYLSFQRAALKNKWYTEAGKRLGY